MTEQAEIEFLEKLYGLNDEVTNMREDWELKQLAGRVLAEEVRAAQRAGHDDTLLTCFFCGHTGKLSRCGCSFPSEFGCGLHARLVCTECESAHLVVARHLQKLFASRVVGRVNSLRAQRFRELRSAARALAGEDSDPCDERSLSFAMADADEFDDDVDIFRAVILNSFRKVRFLGFQGLAQNLKQQADELLIRSIVRAGLAR